MHHQRKIEGPYLQQYPFENIFSSAEIYSPHPSRFVRMCEAAFQQLSSPPQQFFATLSVDASPIAIDSLLGFGFAFPMTLPTIRLRDIAPHLGSSHGLQRVIAVISLVGHCLLRTVGFHPLAYLRSVGRTRHLGDVFPRLR